MAAKTEDYETLKMSVEAIRENLNKQKLLIKELQLKLATNDFESSNLQGQLNSYRKIIENFEIAIKEEEIQLKIKRSKIWKQREDFCEDIDNFEEQFSWEKFTKSLETISKTDYSENIDENLEVIDLKSKIAEIEADLQKTRKQISEYNVKKAEISVIEKDNSEVEQELEQYSSKNNEILEEIKKCEEELKKRQGNGQRADQRAVTQPDIVLSNLNSQIDPELAEDAYSALLRCESEMNVPKKFKYSEPQDSSFRFKTKTSK